MGRCNGTAMSEKSYHPSREEFLLYRRGTLPAEELTRIDKHVFYCPECALRLATLMREESDKLRGKGERDPKRPRS
jgi:hypothetical protein